MDLLGNCSEKNEGYNFARFALIVYVGTPIALLGIVFNAMLIHLFARRNMCKSPTLYLLILAILDMLICLTYVPFFTCDALAIYLQWEWLFHLWHSWVMFLYGTSRLVQFASTYMVLCATIERFIVVSEIGFLRCLITEFGRYLVVIVVIIFSFILRLPAYFDYHLRQIDDCPPFQDYTFDAWLMSVQDYSQYNFYVITIGQSSFPFVCLLVLNFLVIALTKRRLLSRSWVSTFNEFPRLSALLRRESMQGNRQAKSELRYATWTLTAMVFTYLVCNSFSVFVTVMENVFPGNSLMVNDDGSSTGFYTITSDLVSILVALNSMLRIFVYALCNPQFRGLLLKSMRRSRLLSLKHSFFSTVTENNNNNNNNNDDDDTRKSLTPNRSTLSLPAINGDICKLSVSRQKSAQLPTSGL